MFDWNYALLALALMLGLSFCTWLISLWKQDVSIVDSLWSLFFLGATAFYWLMLPVAGTRGFWVLLLIGLWAVRLSGYLTWRNWGEPEDRRYQAIRARNQPRFEFKSLYLVFGLQAVLAWIVALPLLPVMLSPALWNNWDGIGIALFLFGLGFETLADWQLAQFKSRPENQGKVLDQGLWGYSRHPNYFGEFCVWWGVFGLALAAEAPIWTLISPLLMSLLLLKISGVTLLESDIQERRPDYQAYQNRTNAFFPASPKRTSL